MFSEAITQPNFRRSAAFKGAEFKAAPRKRLTPADRLRDALMQLAGGHGTITAHAERNWASITFAGTRHQVTVLFDGEDAVEAGESFIAFLPEHDFAIPGQLVADAAVVEVDHRLAPAPLMVVQVEVLLLEES